MFSDIDYSMYNGIPKKYTHLKNKIFEELEIPPWELIINKNKLLGEGNFGKVYLASWRHTTVVAKIVNDNVSEEKKDLFIKELDVLTKVRHPNIVQFLGYIKDPFIIVMEYLPQGELLYYIKNNVSSNVKKIDICLDILRALTYLHNRQPNYIIHRDIKPQNIVMSDSGKPKLADFGISRFFINKNNTNGNNISPNNNNNDNKDNKDDNDLTINVGAIRYMSPEIKNELIYNHKVDIWSAGIIFSELFENCRYNDEFYWYKTPKSIKNIILQYMLRNEATNRLNAAELIPLFLQEKNKYKNKWLCFF